MNKKDKNIKLDGLSIAILIISGVVILFSFFAPMIFVQTTPNVLDFSNTGQIGDTIGGIMNPFIALAGIFLTFLAFYIQFKANKLQRDLFRLELDNNKFENQFYEMLKLHKENVNEMSLTLKWSYNSGQEKVRHERNIKGRDVFNYFLYELEIAFYVAKYYYSSYNNQTILEIAYSVFFLGLDIVKSYNTEDKNYGKYITSLKEIKEAKTKRIFDNNLKKIKLEFDWHRFNLFEGHSSFLGHYYRHLFQTVKLVANKDETFISYNEKRRYLRILRAQLANQEQTMLFYNWYAGFGKKWENNENKFFTDYRMIHNLFDIMLFENFQLKEIFKLDSNQNYRKEKGRNDDNLFEFQD